MNFSNNNFVTKVQSFSLKYKTMHYSRFDEKNTKQIVTITQKT